MHVKQLTTSQAFQMILRKASVYQEDVKALQVPLSRERATTRGWGAVGAGGLAAKVAPSAGI